MGFFESGIGPTFFPALTTWYTKKEQAFRAPLLNSAQALAVIPASPIFYGCSFIGEEAHAWKYIYYIIGSLTIVWGFLVAIFMPDSPVAAKFLSERERYVAVERIRGNQAGLVNHTVRWWQIWKTFTDPKVLLLCVICFVVTTPNVSSIDIHGSSRSL